MQIRVDQARRFLMAGHKVSFTQRFRGREFMHKELGEERLLQICQDLSDIAKIDVAPKAMGRSITLVLSPDKDKIKTLKARLAQEGKALEDDLEALEAQVAAQNEADKLEEEHDEYEGLSEQEKMEKKKEEKKAKRGPKDDRANNPVDDEVADLLGEI